MNEITLLSKLTRTELLEKLAYAVESLQEYEADSEDTQYLYNSIENITYTLNNCDYKGKEA